MHSKFIAFLDIISRPAVALVGAAIIALGAVGAVWYFGNVSASGTFTQVVMAPITEEVDVSGAVQGVETTDLSFQIPGQVSWIPVAVGDEVGAGQTLVALSGGAQSAALLGAQANLETASATLASLQAGTRPEQLSIDQNTVTQDQESLRDSVRSAFVVADTAVHATADQFFTNPRNSSAELTFIIPDSALTNTVLQERVALEPVLAAWNAQVSDASFAESDPAAPAAQAEQNLTQVNTFLDNIASALTKTQPSSVLSAATIAGYETSISAVRANVSGALSSLTAAETTLTGAEGALTLAMAGATSQTIAIAKAQVDAAQAQVDAAQVASNETVLVAPIAGMVTAQNAHLGQTVSPGLPLVSLIGLNAFEAKVPVSENDIGKVKVGDTVAATFDEYPSETFPATVSAIDPAATVTNGVSSYFVTVSFTTSDPRVRSGLTAHVSIITASLTDTLVIPASAVISDQDTEFVYLKGANGTTKTPVTTGIGSASGMIQVLSGLSAGQEVLTFGSAQ
jgi:HlyD family secretion protein